MKIYAVLTGDLIRSRELAPERLEEAMTLLRRLADEFGAVHAGATVGQPDVFRGDSWQCCLQEPALGVTAAVFFRAGLKAEELDTRIGVGFGPVTLLHEERISESTGPAFVASGDALDTLPKGHALGARHGGMPAAGWADMLQAGAMPLLDLALASWTQREAAAVYGTLRGLTQEQITELSSVRTREGRAPKRQAVQDALRRVAWSSHLEPTLREVERMIKGGAVELEAVEGEGSKAS